MIQQLEPITRYYDLDGVIIRTANLNDVEMLHSRLRKSDVDELWVGQRLHPKTALLQSMKESDTALTIEINGIPEAMFGVCSENIITNEAIIWFLSSEEMFKHKTKFLRNNRKMIDLFLEQYSALYNFVDARNRKSLSWLKWLGATIEQAEPYGYDQMPFHYFYFKRGIR